MSRTRIVPLTALAAVLCHCGGGGGSSTPAGSAPSITGQPQSQAAAIGATATFTVAATGSAPLAYQWKKGGADIAGATASSYTTPVLAAGDNGASYTVSVSNAQGSVLSGAATLTVMAAPAITAQPLNQSVIAGQTATFSVTASGGGTLAYQWQRNGVDLPSATASVLTLPGTALSDSGAQFRVKVSNAVGSLTSSSALLTVSAAPTAVSIDAFSASAPSVAYGGAATLFWTVTGTPTSLTLNGQNVLGQTSAQVSPKNRQTYTLVASSGLNTDTKTVTVAAQGVDLLAGSVGNQGNLDGSGLEARFSSPAAGVIDPAGNLILADRDNHVIRKVTPDGTVTTLAGDPQGLSGASVDGVGTAARFKFPWGIFREATGAYLIAEYGSSKIRRMLADGTVSTVATLPAQPAGLAADASGVIYAACDTVVVKVVNGVASVVAGTLGQSGSADGLGAAARFSGATGIAVDPAGKLYVSDANNYTIRKIDTGGNVTTLAGQAGVQGAVDGTGAAARFKYPQFLSWDGTGALLLGDMNSQAVRRITVDGQVSTVAGKLGSSGAASDGPVATATLRSPTQAAYGPDGRMLIMSDDGYAIRVLDAGKTTLMTLAGKKSQGGETDAVGSAALIGGPSGMATDAGGNVYVTSANDGRIRRITPAGAVTTLPLTLNGPSGIALDPSGNLVVAESGAHRVVRVTPAGVVTPIAGVQGSAGFADGAAATAKFNQPRGIAVDTDGTIYVSDANNHLIRKIDPGLTVSTLAGGQGIQGYANGSGASARFAFPEGLALRADHRLLVADYFNHAIRVVAPDGTTSTLVGGNGNGYIDGPLASALINHPQDVKVGPSGKVYIADYDNHCIRVVEGGTVSTHVGSPGQRGVRPGPLPGTLYHPNSLAVTPAEDVLIGYNQVYAVMQATKN
jgi:sugar lactone lactonase YvrE